MKEQTKVIAFYLPQFHEVKENNEWWGNGFTEWTHVKNAVPLFKGHYQPRVPLNKNYYNLMEKRTVEWQTKLMKQYGIDAFAYYHYWYEGKMLLEKPAENLLKWKDIDQGFMFFWANHTWYQAKKGKKKILIEQTYAGPEDWRKHYEYMRMFFLDKRYVKIGNKPVFGVYMAEDIPDFDQMILVWNDMAKEDGFDGIYIVESINSFSAKVSSNYSDGVVVRQPNLSRIQEVPTSILYKILRKVKKILRITTLKLVDYRKIAYYEKSIDTSVFCLRNAVPLYCVSTGWDNTPRHGKYGQAMINMTPELFKEVVSHLYAKSLKENKDLMFINAWNEWAEGMVLEPDEKYGYQYLEALCDALHEASEKERL